jgi:hypothetical protein
MKVYVELKGGAIDGRTMCSVDESQKEMNKIFRPPTVDHQEGVYV